MNKFNYTLNTFKLLLLLLYIDGSGLILGISSIEALSTCLSFL